MKNNRIFCLFLGFMLLPHGVSIASTVNDSQVQAQQLMEKADRIRNPSGSYRMSVHIEEYENGQIKDTMQVSTVSKPNPDSGDYRTLVAINRPFRDAGKLILRNGQDLWFFDPAAKTSIRISPQQRLLGQVSNGDLMSVNFAKDYQARLIDQGAVSISPKEKTQAYQLELIANHAAATYAKIHFWIDSSNYRPVKGQFFSGSNRLLKTAFYRRYQTALGEERPTEVIIIDGVDVKQVTRMSLSQHQHFSIEDHWFQKEWLPKFSGLD